MGMQSSRLIYRGNDHKDIYFQGKYHRAMFLGNRLLWEKLGERIIPYLSFDGYDKTMCINVLFVDSKTIKKAVRLPDLAFNDFPIVRGDNAVGYFLRDTSWVFSEDGIHYIHTDTMSSGRYPSAYAGYALTKNCFLGVLDYGDVYYIHSRDIEDFHSNGIRGIDKTYGDLFSGYINPKFDIFIYKNRAEGSAYRYNIAEARNPNLGSIYVTGYSYSTSAEVKKPLGANDRYVYMFIYDFVLYPSTPNIVYRYDITLNSETKYFSTLNSRFYANILYSLYENGKFIVYSSEDGRFQIYETTDFLNFTEIYTPRSIAVKDITSDADYIISFDSDVSGDVYLQPYCNLDNTYYFDEYGKMHDNEGCLFHTNINETGFKKIVTIYFDNHYFRESENNYCQILIFEEDDIEPPLFE